MRITWDAEAKAMYVLFREGEVAYTSEMGELYVDYDDSGRPLGVEFLGLDARELNIPGEIVFSAFSG